ncbi:MAG: DUF6498-containing protein [Thermoanaerobaculia bacterium]
MAGKSWSRSLRVVSAVASNSVPLIGVLRFQWPAANLLFLFWAETFFGGIAQIIRIIIHRKLTHLRGHYRSHKDDAISRRITGQPELKTTYLAEFCGTYIPFTLAHVFLLAVGLGVLRNEAGPGSGSQWYIQLHSLVQGTAIIAAVAFLELAVELPFLANRSFASIRLRGDQFLGRILMLHMSLLGGIFLLVWFGQPIAFLAILVGLKLLWDLGYAFYGDKANQLPEKTPGWIRALGRMTDFDADEAWKGIIREQEAELAADERPVIPDQVTPVLGENA